MFEKWKVKWGNATKRWSEYWLRWELKHWRKSDISLGILGFVFVIIAAYTGEPVNIILAIFGVTFLMSGWLCYCYDTAIERVGCMEEVFREIQRWPDKKRESVNAP